MRFVLHFYNFCSELQQTINAIGRNWSDWHQSAKKPYLADKWLYALCQIWWP